MEKSPLMTLTLEDFLETERHKLTGKLTPVTEESFAKWKKDRMDKKAAEAELRKAKEDTGRALFEKGAWMEDSEEESEEEEEAEGDEIWDLNALRQQTEASVDKAEQERILKLSNGTNGTELKSGSREASVNGEGDGGDT
jgi:hypothetical protein